MRRDDAALLLGSMDLRHMRRVLPYKSALVTIVFLMRRDNAVCS